MTSRTTANRQTVLQSTAINCQSSSVQPSHRHRGHRVTCLNDQRLDGRQQRQSARASLSRLAAVRFSRDSGRVVIVSSRQSLVRYATLALRPRSLPECFISILIFFLLHRHTQRISRPRYCAAEERFYCVPQGTGYRGKDRGRRVPPPPLILPRSMTTEEKFNAAVNVIRSLPKNGAYQPSHEIMLRFYSYYKQATEGPCQQSKPAFWEVIKKAKWDAWTRLGNMSRTEAMNNYVEELKKIVETMSYTDNVATFLGSLDSFYESVPAEDLELLVGPVLERIRSQPGSPLSGSPLVSRETSPHRVMNTSRHITSSLETSPTSSRTASPLPQDTDGEEEEFIDTVESAPEKTQKDAFKSSTQKLQTTAKNGTDHSSTENIVKENTELTNGYSNINGHTETVTENHRERGRQRTKKDDNKINAEFLNQIATTMQHLQRDLDRITARVRGLEGQALQVLAPQMEHINRRRYAKWWPLQECPPRLFALLILWPFVVHLLINFMQRYRQRRL